MICAFTGHRPERLPWGMDETDPRCLALKQMLSQKVDEAVAMGCTEFLCGMARGCDLFFAECVLEKRRSGMPIRLIAMLPCPEQANRWRKSLRQRYADICAACDGVEVLEPVYTNGCMLRRNRVMVDRAQVLISVYDGGSGGTAETVHYAQRRNRQILPVWL